MPRVDSASESDADSVSESGDSDANDAATHTYNSTGNHRNFAATPAGHTVTMTANLQQRPRLGQDTLDRIDFDIHTDTDTEHRARRPHPQHPSAASQRPPVNAPLASPRAAATITFGMNAADYQQHLASRTLTSPAIRTLIGDRSKSPDSPTPAPSIDGVLHPGKHRSSEHHNSSRPQPRATRQASVSAFEDLARQLQHDVELTRGANHRGRLAEDADDASASNSGGSGFGPGSHASSARTRVDSDNGRTRNKAFEPSHFNAQGFPAQQKTAAAGADVTAPWGVRLPDVTGLTSALGSPVKGRDAVEHRPFDAAVGNQDARLDELAHLRGFVDGIQVELDRAGERILNLEQAHEQQSHDFQGLRSEMQSAINSVRATQPHDDEQLVQRILRQLRVSPHEHQHAAHGVVQDHQPQSAPAPAAGPSSEARPARGVQADVRVPRESSTTERSQVEVVNRLYAELEQLRTTMEEHYRSAAGLASDGAQPSAREHVYQHRDHWPAGRDPWDAIEVLRLQVLSLASEVERLSGVVSSGARQRHSRSDAARYRFATDQREASYHEAHAASDPGEAGRYARSSTPPRAHSHSHSHSHSNRRVSFGRSSPTRFAEEGAMSDDYDRTLDAVAENVRVQRERQRRRSGVAEEEEISQLASARAERASARVGCGTHDAGRCSVCASTARSDRRRASRKARLLAAEQRRDAVQLEESVLLSAGKLTGEQEETLRTVLQEHWDEFVHQRMLYAELADELKAFDPAMSKPKRTLLAQHVLEAVEALEQKADRINRLEELLKTPQPQQAQQNRLRTAIESFEKARQNSPPTSMQL